ncbi:hypothetical protein GO013_16325 [Pseudodesulfovibrio sp. JC047]|uniref:hypothetical protein n=1 Tax=Pseudodesulfovibrio sp. JC047 TaxID=2683199 RepID=UPI0013CFEF06|nr:hypothetical protein [Pseudodesulfovibrio sp. JC047]NDV20979.1 hypothetical protein [Pseudodesulfovibrio sp. JC047]
MDEVTRRIHAIEQNLSQLLDDAKNGVVHLPERGRVGLAQRFLEGILDERTAKARRVSAMVARNNGMDRSVPRGDRNEFF